MGVYGSFTGTVMTIQDFWRETGEPAGCVKLMTPADCRDLQYTKKAYRFLDIF